MEYYVFIILILQIIHGIEQKTKGKIGIER